MPLLSPCEKLHTKMPLQDSLSANLSYESILGPVPKRSSSYFIGSSDENWYANKI